MKSLTELEAKLKDSGLTPHGDARTVLSTPGAFQIGSTYVSMTAMVGLRAAVFLNFSAGQHTGMQVSMHGTVDEVRRLARELLRHADAADAAQKQPQSGAGVPV
ncbi:hypothetical protein [Dyella sp. ASV21]|uniref:hypothetical protein n=1 Tax=Dyella sp. ASV21 TaxID=2795114 RepID=UPI0018ECAE22|nr:hypothetical protein [Dyella sp. ASV21]